MVLEKINQPNDIKSLTDEELKILASEIREFLIEKISVTGGHLASNLGVVELTMALHLALDLPKDKIIWDVGHQSYTHKLLTGRREGFDGLRKYGGMSGFPKRKESECPCRRQNCCCPASSGLRVFPCASFPHRFPQDLGMRWRERSQGRTTKWSL